MSINFTVVEQLDQHYRTPIGQTPILSDDDFRLVSIVNFVIICQAVDVFGTIANVLNMIVFLRIGFTDTINISLLALAFCDFGACFVLIWHTVSLNPWFQELDLPFDTTISYLTSSWPHVIFTRMTTLLTAFISFERCLCVITPLKVKDILTRRLVITVVVSTFMFGLGSFSFLYSTNAYAWRFNPDRNRTVFALVFSENREQLERYFTPVLNIFFPLFSFITIAVSTTLLVISLKKSSKWKQQITSTSSSNNGAAIQQSSNDERIRNVSSKELKVAKMVSMLSIMFIVCFFPDVFIIQISMVADPSISIDGVNRNMLRMFSSVSFILESVNSSCNIFIYYGNSSNYRNMFDQTFRFKTCCGDKKNKATLESINNRR